MRVTGLQAHVRNFPVGRQTILSACLAVAECLISSELGMRNHNFVLRTPANQRKKWKTEI